MCNAAGTAAGRAKTNAEPILREDETLREHCACVIWRWLDSLKMRDAAMSGRLALGSKMTSVSDGGAWMIDL